MAYRVISEAVWQDLFYRYCSSIHATLAEAVEALGLRLEEGYDRVSLAPVGRR